MGAEPSASADVKSPAASGKEVPHNTGMHLSKVRYIAVACNRLRAANTTKYAPKSPSLADWPPQIPRGPRAAKVSSYTSNIFRTHTNVCNRSTMSPVPRASPRTPDTTVRTRTSVKPICATRSARSRMSCAKPARLSKQSARRTRLPLRRQSLALSSASISLCSSS